MGSSWAAAAGAVLSPHTQGRCGCFCSSLVSPGRLRSSSHVAGAIGPRGDSAASSRRHLRPERAHLLLLSRPVRLSERGRRSPVLEPAEPARAAKQQQQPHGARRTPWSGSGSAQRRARGAQQLLLRGERLKAVRGRAERRCQFGGLPLANGWEGNPAVIIGLGKLHKALLQPVLCCASFPCAGNCAVGSRRESPAAV